MSKKRRAYGTHYFQGIKVNAKNFWKLCEIKSLNKLEKELNKEIGV